MTIDFPCLFHGLNSATLSAMKRVIFLLSLLVLLAGCSHNDNATVWPLDKSCNLHQQACTATHGDQAVTLAITPRPIPVAKPLQVEVRLRNIPAKQVALDISGLNMYMGYNRVTLKQENNDVWTGSSMLAFCTNDTMQWQLTVLIDTPDGQQIQVPFYLETHRNPTYPTPVKE
ncbi:hypothetical protein SAMN05443662_0279 [Sulfurivirga caldicuralii]|uniref:Type IV secretion system putative lipoprotein virB7 n=2 Tax=Sulfurivirga caldicuralii TaxID=364032 RepID=A0A1N6DMB8_9GAMM|nr:hypothetical protein SAMN05443662_0279 [Sulfurivirga caldicuralii]